MMVVMLLTSLTGVASQDYSVTDINCQYGGNAENGLISAKLSKPEGFQGVPIFADDRAIDPETSEVCSIRRIEGDTSGLEYHLNVTDFSSCGVVLRNGFVSLRIWFPKLRHVVMMSDQEVIIMCKPPQSITLSMVDTSVDIFPSRSRVSGEVAAKSGPLVYEVALYREVDVAKSKDGEGNIEEAEAVPIGARLQLRASIDTSSVWQHVRLQSVVLSPDSSNPKAPGSVTLVRDGCRVEEFASIVPRQPWLKENSSAEVRLEFEAVLLDVSRRGEGRLWVHVKSVACTTKAECRAAECGGRKKKRRSIGNDQPRSSMSRRGVRTDQSPLSRSIGGSRSSYYNTGTGGRMVETQLYVEEADHLENLEDLETQPYMEKEEVDYLESLEELDLARLSVEMQQATGFQDNVGVTVVMPGEDIRQAANNEVGKSIEFPIEQLTCSI